MSRNELWELHRDYADSLAARFSRGLPPFIQLDDLKQAARLGLWKATGNYQEDRGQFKTHAYYLIQHELSLERVRHLPWGGGAYHHNNEGMALPAVLSLENIHYDATAPELTPDVLRLIHRFPRATKEFALMFWIEGLSDLEIQRRTGRPPEFLRGLRKRLIQSLKIIADQECY